jgi:hypothetical protein
MDAKPTSATLKKRLRRQLAALGKKQPFIVGSLVKIQRRCGNPNCRCAREGPKHPAHLLTTKVNGKTRAIYVPVDMVGEVRQWRRQYRDIKADIKEVSECCEQLIRLHAKEKRSRSGKRRRSNGT